jgi:XXXCH domain-containing protein
MDSKRDKTWRRSELADELTRIAEKLRKGRLAADNGEWSVPDTIDATFRFREKKGRFEAKLKWRWSTLPDYAPSEREAVDHRQGSVKRVKKGMTSAFKRLRAAIQSGRFPGAADLEAFTAASTAFAGFAESEWEDAMGEFLDHLENLRLAVEREQFEVVAHELRDLENNMKKCHREFK